MSLSYRQLQAIAKGLGVKANLSRAKLEKAIAEAQASAAEQEGVPRVLSEGSKEAPAKADALVEKVEEPVARLQSMREQESSVLMTTSNTDAVNSNGAEVTVQLAKEVVKAPSDESYQSARKRLRETSVWEDGADVAVIPVGNSLLAEVLAEEDGIRRPEESKWDGSPSHPASVEQPVVTHSPRSPRGIKQKFEGGIDFDAFAKSSLK